MNETDYALWMSFIAFVFSPLYLASVLVLVEDKDTCTKCIMWGLGIACFAVVFLFYQMLNMEVTYGKELLDRWYRTQQLN